MCNESENTTRPNPETKEAFFRMASAAAGYLRDRNEENLAYQFEAIVERYQQAKSFDRSFTEAFRSILIYIRSESIHYEKIGRGLFEAHHGRSATGNQLFAIAREVAPQGVLHGDTPAADIDNLYIEYAGQLAQAIAGQENAEALLMAIIHAIEEHLRKELSNYNQIQQMSWFRLLLQESIGSKGTHIHTLRWLPAENNKELLVDFEGFIWHLKHNGFYAEATALAKVALDSAIKLCGSEDKESIRAGIAYAHILAETGDYCAAAEYGFQPLKAQAKAVIAVLQDADEKTQWQNNEVEELRTTLRCYIDMLMQAPLRLKQQLSNIVYWWHLIRAQELLRLIDSNVSIAEKIGALLPLAAEVV